MGGTGLNAAAGPGDGSEHVSLVERFDRYQRGHRWISMPLGVLYKFLDDQANYLTVIMTYYAFLAILPLLLLATTILGFVLSNNQDLLREILNSAVGQFPVVGNQLTDEGGVSGTGFGLAIGIVGTLYGSLGFAQAIQNAMNSIWRVPRNRRPNPIFSRLRSVLLISSIAVASGGTTAITALAANFDEFPLLATVGIEIGSFVINALLFTATFWFATARDMSWRDTVPGAIGAAVIWQFLQIGATSYVNHVVKHAHGTNGVFALVLGLLAWLYLQSLVVVLAAEFNTVRAHHLYPRALLTIFTDDVHLTEADREVYTEQAEAQQAKGFENIEVTFDEHPPPPGPG